MQEESCVEESAFMTTAKSTERCLERVLAPTHLQGAELASKTSSCCAKGVVTIRPIARNEVKNKKSLTTRF